MGGFNLLRLPKRFDINRFVVVNVQHRHAFAEELLEVLVFRDDSDVDIARCRFVKHRLCDRGDDVVSFQFHLTERQDTERFQHLLDAVNLRYEFGRWRRAMRFVVRIKFVSEGFAGRIYRGNDILCLQFGEEFEQGARKTENSIGRFARDGAGELRPNGVVRPKYLGVRVKDV